MRIAAIDVGSNSIHMVVAEVEGDGRFRVLDRARDMVRLGRHTLNRGRLSAAAIDRGVQTLKNFRTLAERYGVTRITAVGTSPIREAANGGDFIQQAQGEVGIRVKVIHGGEEARLIYLGVRHAMDLRRKRTLIVDVGGGSVEFILVERGEPTLLESSKIGVTRLTERFLTGDPPDPVALADLKTHLTEQLEPLLTSIRSKRVARVIGTSGTMLNLTAIGGELRGEPPDGHLNNFRVSVREIGSVRRLLVRKDRTARLRIKGLDAKRVDLIIAGAVLADYVLRRVGAKELIACTWALREGVLLDFVARHQKRIEETERYAAPRGRSVARLARHLGETGAHGSQVARLALRLFDQLEDQLPIDRTAREWLEFAALLHDVGHHIDHENHHRHSYYLITNSELLGFQHEEVEIIGQTARYHRKGGPKDSDPEFGALSRQNRQTVRTLSAILRVADALDRSHYGVIRDVVVARGNGRLTLQLRTRGADAALEVWDANQRARLIEHVLGLDVDFQVVS